MPNMTPKEFAVAVGSDGRTVRKFLRSEAGLNARVGKGSRWTLESRSIRSLKAKFAKWDAARTPAEADATPDAVEVPETDTDA